MQVIHEYIDKEHYVEVLLTEAEVLNILAGIMIAKPYSIAEKIFNIGIRTVEEEDATS